MANVIWTPQPRQAALMARFEDEALYGGAAGGGGALLSLLWRCVFANVARFATVSPVWATAAGHSTPLPAPVSGSPHLRAASSGRPASRCVGPIAPEAAAGSKADPTARIPGNAPLGTADSSTTSRVSHCQTGRTARLRNGRQGTWINRMALLPI